MNVLLMRQRYKGTNVCPLFFFQHKAKCREWKTRDEPLSIVLGRLSFSFFLSFLVPFWSGFLFPQHLPILCQYGKEYLSVCVCFPVSNLSPIHPIHPIHLIHFCSTCWIVCSRTIRQWTTQHKQQGHWPSPLHRIADKVFFVLFWFLLVLGSCSFSSPQICIGIETKQCLHIISVHAPLSHFFFCFFLFSVPPISLSNWTCTLFFFLSLSTAHPLTTKHPLHSPRDPNNYFVVIEKEKVYSTGPYHVSVCLCQCVNMSMCTYVHVCVPTMSLLYYHDQNLAMMSLFVLCKRGKWCGLSVRVYSYLPFYRFFSFLLCPRSIPKWEWSNRRQGQGDPFLFFYVFVFFLFFISRDLAFVFFSFLSLFPTHQPSSISYIPISNISCLFTYYLSTLCANTPLSFLFASHVSLSLTRLHYFYLFLEPENNNQKETSLNLPLCVAVSQQPKEKKRSRTAQRPLCLYFPRLSLSYVVFFVLIAVTQSLGANNPISFSQ